ncbi:non-ribosomal peptide synthetase [Lewinella sp. IMCC34183]|uniref:non-ribosomal peptide synthetase n=1 Tax=Lewinella sp. IMCC34183 TaxID=2248762 RepID=UPI000E256762|nr:non-ribosomal peptide synthetase [Lewinella sp. IMCC34183]
MSKLSLLQRWRNRKPTPATESPEAAVGDYPLSYGQARLWSLAELYPDNPFYNYAEAYDLHGDLDAERLRQALTTVVERHEILRSVFFTDAAGTVRQRSRPTPDYAYEAIDLAGRPLTDEALLSRSRAPFDLERGPLVRVVLWRRDARHHVLLIVMHHIVTDKASMARLREEVVRLYDGGSAAHLPPLPLQYGPFAVRQRGADNAGALAYWAEQLADAPALLDLPTDHVRPAQQSFRGQFLEHRLPAALASRIRRQCRERGITTFTYFLAAYWLLLTRQTGQEDLLVGTPITTRDRQDTEHLIGFFNETVVLRGHTDRAATFTELLQQAGEVLLAAFQHKQAPFDRIVRAVNPERVRGANPLFQAMLITHKVEPPPPFAGDLRWTHRMLDLGVTKFDLTLYVAEAEDDLTVVFEYATDLFTRDHVYRMVNQLEAILSTVSEQPDAALDQLTLLAPEAIERLAAPPDRVAQQPPTVAAGIAAAIRERPQATAVRTGGDTVTYASLDDRARRLAGELKRRGVRPGEVVGLHLGRTGDFPIAVYACWLLGAAYLPLDPAYPVRRLAFMVADAGARIVITDGEPDAQLGEVEFLSPADSAGAPLPAGPLPDDPDLPAYLIYTSGSSGTPKGVRVSHRNLYHSTAAREQVYGDPPTTFLLLSSFSFDSSVVGLFWTLTGGGTLLIARERAEQDMVELGRTIHRYGVTHTLMLPTLYRALLDTARRDDLTDLHTVIVAGEACTADLVRHHHATLPGVRLFNEYGPTETTVWCTACALQPADAADGRVPVGRAVPGYRIYLTDDRYGLVPDGAVGEICVAGAGLTEGYHDAPQLTATKFGTLQLPDGRTERIYRTGDLGQWRADGALLFLGRKDRQVKVRGYRIELESIRQRLLSYPGVREAEVILDGAGRRLIAYAVGDEALNAQRIRTTFGEDLPAYMVPARIRLLGEMPRLPNGKVDTGRLPAAGPSPTLRDAADAHPENETEERLLSIFRELLGDASAGVRDSFFALGGDSVTSIQLLSRARAAGIEFEATAIFDHQSVRELARVARSTGGEVAPREAYSGPVGLTPIQRWFFSEHTVAPYYWNHAWRITLTPEAADATAVARAAARLEARHEGLRQQFSRGEEGWTALIRPAGEAPRYYALDKLPDPLAEWLEREQRGVDLARDPLFRVYHFQADDTVILWAHHLVVDVVSWHQLFAEFAAELNGSPHPAGPATYHRWTQQTREWAEQDRFGAELEYWARQQGSPLPTELPGSLPVRQESIHTLTGSVDGSVTSSLLTAANEAYGTKPEELILTALLRTLAGEHPGGDGYCLNLERYGRIPGAAGLDFSGTVGWLTASFPLRFDLRDPESPETSIVDVKDRLRALPQQGVGYGVLRYLQGANELTGDAGIYFNYLGATAAPRQDPYTSVAFLTDGLRAPEGEVNRTWELNVSVADGALRIDWSFSTELHRPATVARLLKKMEEEIRAIVAHCLERDGRRLTASDFPDAGISEDDLEGLMDELGL